MAVDVVLGPEQVVSFLVGELKDRSGCIEAADRAAAAGNGDDCLAAEGS